MEHRDRIILQKVLSEIGIAQEMMEGCTLDQFRQNEMLMRAVGMTVINIGAKASISPWKTSTPHSWRATSTSRSGADMPGSS